MKLKYAFSNFVPKVNLTPPEYTHLQGVCKNLPYESTRHLSLGQSLQTSLHTAQCAKNVTKGRNTHIMTLRVVLFRVFVNSPIVLSWNFFNTLL